MTAAVGRTSRDAIFLTVDAAYAEMLQLLLESLNRWYPGHPAVVVGTSGWSDRLRGAFRTRFPDVRWLDLHSLVFPTGPPMGHDASLDRPVMYARWAALAPAFDAYETVVYLDADTLVLGPFDELFAASRPMAFTDAHPNRRQMVFDDPEDPGLRLLLVEDGLEAWPWDTGANAGVIVLPRPFRTPGQYAEAQRLAERYAPFLRWGDQSVLNLWLARNRILPTRDYRFNYQARLLVEGRERQAWRDARILHFNGQHGEAPFLMALVTTLLRFGAPGRWVVPQAVRWARSPGVDRLPGYQARRWLRRRLMCRTLATGYRASLVADSGEADP